MLRRIIRRGRFWPRKMGTGVWNRITCAGEARVLQQVHASHDSGPGAVIFVYCRSTSCRPRPPTLLASSALWPRLPTLPAPRSHENVRVTDDAGQVRLGPRHSPQPADETNAYHVNSSSSVSDNVTANATQALSFAFTQRGRSPNCVITCTGGRSVAIEVARKSHRNVCPRARHLPTQSQTEIREGVTRSPAAPVTDPPQDELGSAIR